MRYEVLSYEPGHTVKLYDGENMNIAMCTASVAHQNNAAKAHLRGLPRGNPIIALYQDGLRALTYAAKPTDNEQKGWTLECSHNWPLQ